MSDIRRTLLFLVKEDLVCLALKKRGFGEGKINGVGGKLEAGETVEQALVRECQEEIGVTPTQYHKVAELDFTQTSAAPDAFHIYGYVYLCTEWEGEPTETDEMAPDWYRIPEIPYDQMWDDDRYWLPRVLSGEHLTATFTFNEHDVVTKQTIVPARFT